MMTGEEQVGQGSGLSRVSMDSLEDVDRDRG